MEQCNNNHKEKINDINSNIEKIDILSERFEDHHKMLLENIPKELDDNPEEEEEEEKKEININNDEEDDYKKVDIRKTKEDLIIIENLLENPEFQAKNEEDKRELLKLMNQIKEATSNIEVKLNRQGEQIDNVNNNVEKAKSDVEEWNYKHLEEAAKSAVKRRGIKYTGGLALTLGIIGTIVPGIGNVVGATLGGIIGYGIHKYDEHRLDTVLEKNKKIREERNNQ